MMQVAEAIDNQKPPSRCPLDTAAGGNVTGATSVGRGTALCDRGARRN